MSSPTRKLEISLLALRVSVAAVMLVWAVDKLVRPEHSSSVFAGFYGMPGVGEGIVVGLGVVQLLLVLAFLAGVARTWTYGASLLLHTVGAKTGKHRTNTLSYFPDGGHYYVVASKGGDPRAPG